MHTVRSGLNVQAHSSLPELELELRKFFRSSLVSPLIVIFRISIGTTGLSSIVLTFEIASTTSLPDSTCPKTGC